MIQLLKQNSLSNKTEQKQNGRKVIVNLESNFNTKYKTNSVELKAGCTTEGATFLHRAGTKDHNIIDKLVGAQAAYK